MRLDFEDTGIDFEDTGKSRLDFEDTGIGIYLLSIFDSTSSFDCTGIGTYIPAPQIKTSDMRLGTSSELLWPSLF